MSTETSGASVALEGHAETAAEHAQATTESVVNSVVEHAEELIDDANRRAETAEALNEALMGAATEAAITKTVEERIEAQWLALGSLEERVTRSEQQNLQLQETVSSLESRLAEALTALQLSTVIAAESAEQSSTPPISETVQPEALESQHEESPVESPAPVRESLRRIRLRL